MGLTTGTAIGIALRNKRVSRNYRWGYHGVSQEDQMTPKAVIKVCCSTGVTTRFETIADAARDVGISAPGLRVRILTDVHREDHHWKFVETN